LLVSDHGDSERQQWLSAIKASKAQAKATSASSPNKTVAPSTVVAPLTASAITAAGLSTESEIDTIARIVRALKKSRDDLVQHVRTNSN
jgi:hypothetical protein